MFAFKNIIFIPGRKEHMPFRKLFLWNLSSALGLFFCLLSVGFAAELKKPHVTVVYTADIRGTILPCA